MSTSGYSLQNWWHRQVLKRGLGWWLLLLPLSWLYRLAWGLRQLFYVKSALQFSAVSVLSVGNLSVGGTGKTPLVIALAQRLSKKKKVCVISRGYGRAAAEGTLLVSAGAGPILDPGSAGDEPWLIAIKTKGVAVVVDVDRPRAARYAVDTLKAELLILDDGFGQRKKLARDVDLLVADPPRFQSAARLLPAGRLREPLSQAAQADALVLQTGQEFSLGALPVLEMVRQAGRLRFLGSQRQAPMLRKKRVLALSGIGNPADFEQMLLKMGAAHVLAHRFPDHWSYDFDDVAQIEKRAKAEAADFIVTTEKDEARLLGIPPSGRFLVLELKLSLKPEKIWKQVLAPVEA